MKAIEFKGVKKRRGNFQLSIDDLLIESGYITGFIGPNGSGKTTTIKLIMNMLKIDSGIIKVFNNDIRDYFAYKSEIGYVGDEAGFLDTVKVKNIKKYMSNFYEKWDEDLYKKYISKFRIDENKLYKDFSKGQKKQFELIIALSHHPKLIIMDEPTANLDPRVRSELLEMLQEHIEREEATVFYSTHITSDLEKTADYIVMIYEGKIILTGIKDELLEEHAIIRGKTELLGMESEKILRGIKINRYGFEGMTSDKNKAFEIFGKEVVYDKATLEDILLFYTRGDENA
ncbi:ABC transporter ATP-binding protein [Clostridium paraputrificum]|uniref:ABC transporter ATP-binding protein n=1 Tax=Clostridium paraputrificum TaxID=29363 RepID=UPI000EA18FE5|nr:ABC transporter ATP-binding protein [Clostridium paraputrificum]MDB2110865.1 ABC transporter ATP-binding protein [Clostridium paraputrificum]RKI46578.1 ABC transporter ATP-binding protein [Clostridium paraputrificum]